MCWSCLHVFFCLTSCSTLFRIHSINIIQFRILLCAFVYFFCTLTSTPPGCVFFFLSEDLGGRIQPDGFSSTHGCSKTSEVRPCNDLDPRHWQGNGFPGHVGWPGLGGWGVGGAEVGARAPGSDGESKSLKSHPTDPKSLKDHPSSAIQNHFFSIFVESQVASWRCPLLEIGRPREFDVLHVFTRISSHPS